MTPGLQSEPTLQVVPAQPPPLVDQVAQALTGTVSPLDLFNTNSRGLAKPEWRTACSHRGLE